MQPIELVELFDQLAADLTEALAGHSNWGLTETVPGQYHHDLLADDLIVAALHDHGLRTLTEESGVSGVGAITVVVDPIDGSTNAAMGLPWYATSLCAVDDEGPLAAGVYNLATGRSYRAIRNEGAESLDTPLAPEACTSLSDAIVAFSGLPPSHGGWRQYRAYGAGALDLCAVADGTFSAFVDVDAAHGVWDYLGAWLVCKESGVVLAERDDNDLVVMDPDVRRGPLAAATPELMTEIKAMIDGWHLPPSS